MRGIDRQDLLTPAIAAAAFAAARSSAGNQDDDIAADLRSRGDGIQRRLLDDRLSCSAMTSTLMQSPASPAELRDQGLASGTLAPALRLGGSSTFRS